MKDLNKKYECSIVVNNTSVLVVNNFNSLDELMDMLGKTFKYAKGGIIKSNDKIITLLSAKDYQDANEIGIIIKKN